MKHNLKYPAISSALLGLVLLGYQNCTEESGFSPLGSISLTATPGEVILPDKIPDSEKTLCEDEKNKDTLICNPLGGGNPPAVDPTKEVDVPSVPKSELGLIAKIYEGQNQWNDLNRYAREGYEHPEKMYFSNFNVPNRSFTEGFTYGDKDFLKDKNGAKLVEWFGISAFGHIVLPENGTDGYYHIATISDDGVKVTVGDELLINALVPMSATIKCASKLVYLEKGVKQTFQLDYYQGPRTEIALMAFIKKVNDPTKFNVSKDCGSGSAPKTLQDKGYEVISPSYFTLPDTF
jgi:hypothetical protein